MVWRTHARPCLRGQNIKILFNEMWLVSLIFRVWLYHMMIVNILLFLFFRKDQQANEVFFKELEKCITVVLLESDQQAVEFFNCMLHIIGNFIHVSFQESHHQEHWNLSHTQSSVKDVAHFFHPRHRYGSVIWGTVRKVSTTKCYSNSCPSFLRLAYMDWNLWERTNYGKNIDRYEYMFFELYCLMYSLWKVWLFL